MKKILWWWVIAVVALLVAVATSLFSLFRGESDSAPSPSPAISTSIVVATPSPTPTPTPTISPVLSPKPTSSPSPSPKLTPSPVASTAATTTSSSVRLVVPFTIQAPDGQWVDPWDEGCEEAALIMADAFNKGNKTTTLPVAETKQQIKEMVDWQLTRFGSHKDIGLDEMAIVAKEYMNYSQVTVKHNATLEDIRNELRRGKPVIVPAAGRLLKNPHFTSPGPIYHVFIITGFEGSNFIVNENGTRHGRSYVYSASTLESAIHDYRPGEQIVDGDMAYMILED